MPIRFLTWFQKQLKRKQLPETEDTKKNKEKLANEPSGFLAFDLRSYEFDKNLLYRKIPGNFYTYQKFLALCLMVFSFVLLLNGFLDFRLRTLKSQQDSWVSLLSQYEDTELKALDLDKKISYYKKSLSYRQLLAQKTFLVTDLISKDTSINVLKITPEGFVLTAEGPNPLVFTQLISAYLSSGQISQILLESAQFNTQEKTFSVSMEGVFK